MTAMRDDKPVQTGRDTPVWTVLGGVSVMLGGLIARATVNTQVLPGWDSDPTVFSLPAGAMGPAGSLAIDAATLAGAAAVMIGSWKAGAQLGWGWIIALAVFAAGIVLHGWALDAGPRGDLGDLRTGMPWLAALAAGIAAMAAARVPGAGGGTAARRTIFGVMLGLVVLLALRGVVQVVLDHPAMMAAFHADRDRWLAARGWTPESPLARAYIRRLGQAEATGWFGLSNVYASFAAAGAGMGLAWLIAAARGGRAGGRAAGGGMIAAAVSLVAGAAGLWAADSKGGAVVAVIAGVLAGLGTIAAGSTAKRARIIDRAAALLGPLCIAGALIAVVIRGMIGERIGELSILFRWFYMQAAARIFAERPVSGVGPDGFQAAYLHAKNPLSPEEVASPHSILFDWLATLGLFGLAGAAALIAMSVLIGRALVNGSANGDGGAAAAPKVASRPGMLALAGAAIVAMWVETPYIPPEMAIVRLAALGIGCWIVHIAVTAAPRAAIRIGLAAAALAMLAHAQIEMTASNIAAAGLVFCVLGAATGGLGLRASSNGTADEPRAVRPALLAGGILTAVLAVGVLGLGAAPVRGWENRLLAAEKTVRPIAEIAERAAAAFGPPVEGRRREDASRLIADVARITGKPVARSERGWIEAMARVDRAILPAAAGELLKAHAMYPGEWRTAREAARLHLRLVVAAQVLGDEAGVRRAADSAIAAIEAASVGNAEANPPFQRARAMVFETLWKQTGSTEMLDRAIQTLRLVLVHSPYDLDSTFRLFTLLEAAGKPAEAAELARKALELDDLARLDRLTRGLEPEQRKRVETAAAAKPGKPGS